LPILIQVSSLAITGVKIFIPIINIFLNIFNFSENIIEKPSDWNSWTWQQQQQWNWNWASFSTSPLTKAPIIESVNSLGPSFTPIILSKPPQSFPIMTLKKPFLPNVSF